MAQSGQLQAQRTSASIGQQESANQKAMASEAGRLQTMEAQGATDVASMRAQGEQVRQQREMDRASTLMGMAQGDAAGAAERVSAARAGQFEALGNIAGAATGFF